MAVSRETRRAEKRRRLESRWALFADNGYTLYTACTSCGDVCYCRGRYRDSVKCKECFFGG